MIDLGAGRAYRTDLADLTGNSSDFLVNGYIRDESWTRPSQREIAVAPGGGYLAYRYGSGITIERASGEVIAEVNHVADLDFRFSPDGRSLAYFAHELDSACCSVTVGVVDLESGEARALSGVNQRGVAGEDVPGRLAEPAWLEWTRDGVVALFESVSHSALLLLPREGGEPRRLYAGDRIHRFTAASRGTRVVFFDRVGAWELDLAREVATPKAPDGASPGEPPALAPPPRLLRRLGAPVGNAELSADGAVLAYAVPGSGVFLHRAGEEPERLGSAAGVHSLWVSADGDAVLFARPAAAVLVELARGLRRRFSDPKRQIRSVRFRQDGAGVVVAAGSRVYSWSPEEGRRRVIYTAVSGRRIEAAAPAGDRLAVWSSEKQEPRNARRRKAAALPKWQQVVESPFD